MKKISVILLSLCISILMNAQQKAKGVIFETGTLQQALAKAAAAKKKAPKIVFVDCYTVWCGPCKYMTNTVFPMEHVGEYFNKNFVNIKIDMEKGEGIDIKNKYNIRAFPTFLILDAQGNEINRILGSAEADVFIEKVKKAQDPSTSPAAKKAVYEGNKSFANALAYLEAAQFAYMKAEVKQFVEEIFPTLSSRDKYSEKLWPYLSPNLSDPQSVIFNTVLVEKSDADKTLTKERVDAALRSCLISYAMSYVRGTLKDVNSADVLNKLNYLSYLEGNNQETSMILRIARLYSENKIKEIESFLNMRNLGGLSDASRGLVEKMIFGIKEISSDSKLKYSNSKVEYYNSLITSIKKDIEKLQK
ncbi:MAG: thioredoxin family protein [Bacteroidales bacterium]|nr:thioredoxin family protein [Bacteroidales bacterium]MDD2425955.1 thioredoxin family protein [Bacteroidales bacterium]MDD3990180.1 thioredoxin family protein [Bacteroidales bacterium]